MIVCIGIMSLCNLILLQKKKEKGQLFSDILYIMIIGLTKWLLALPLIALGLQLKQERAFYKIDGKSVLGNITAVREAKDLIECSFQCIEFGPVPCLSFSLKKTNRNVRICELSNTWSHKRYTKDQDTITTKRNFRLVD